MTPILSDSDIIITVHNYFSGIIISAVGDLLTLLSGLKSSGCTLMASVTPETPCAAGEFAEMMAYATPGLLAAVEMPCAYKGDEELSSCPLDSLS